jgi:hypothetical protein
VQSRELERWAVFLDRLRGLVDVEVAALVVSADPPAQVSIRCDGDEADTERLRGAVARWVQHRGASPADSRSAGVREPEEGALRFHLVPLPPGGPAVAIVVGTPRRDFPTAKEVALMDLAAHELEVPR